jgi:hypothetical protein
MLEEIVERVRRLDRHRITIVSRIREATEEEQAAIDRQRDVMGRSNPFSGSSESDDI